MSTSWILALGALLLLVSCTNLDYRGAPDEGTGGTVLHGACDDEDGPGHPWGPCPNGGAGGMGGDDGEL